MDTLTEVGVDLVKLIASADGAQLDTIEAMIDRRRKALEGQTFRELKVGDRVRLKNGRPKYLMGALATITDKKQTKVVIELDEAIGTFPKGSPIRCHISLIEKVDA